MLTDYKFWYILRDDDGFIVEAGVRFYEGAVQSVTITSPITGLSVPVNRYVRTRRLQKADLGHLMVKPSKKEKTGDDALIYTTEDFGRIKTDAELCAFLNTELTKDKSRTPIPDQRP